MAERMSDARSKDSGVPCPGCESTGEPFPDAAVILHVPQSTWNELVKARESLVRTLVSAVDRPRLTTANEYWKDRLYTT